MAGKATVALTEKEYHELIDVLTNGCCEFRPKPAIAAALVIEANLGIRIEDVLSLKLDDIVKDGSRRRLDIVEQKTQKKRTFTVPTELYEWIQDYCLDNSIKRSERIFNFSERNVQKYLKLACEYLYGNDPDGNYRKIGTHSFRKYFATDIYNNNGFNLVLVQRLLQHSSAKTTQRYIGISQRDIEDAIQNHIRLPEEKREA